MYEQKRHKANTHVPALGAVVHCVILLLSDSHKNKNALIWQHDQSFGCWLVCSSRWRCITHEKKQERMQLLLKPVCTYSKQHLFETKAPTVDKLWWQTTNNTCRSACTFSFMFKNEFSVSIHVCMYLSKTSPRKKKERYKRGYVNSKLGSVGILRREERVVTRRLVFIWLCKFGSGIIFLYSICENSFVVFWPSIDPCSSYSQFTGFCWLCRDIRWFWRLFQTHFATDQETHHNHWSSHQNNEIDS